MGKVKRIRFDDEGNVTTVLFRGRDLGTNTHADEIELMQSTGLCDKEGTEVFEGDILHHQIQTEYTFIVKYDKDKGRWYGDGLSRTYRIDIAKRFLPHYYKVIGNIYENQELLEVENEN
jgi:uncharacterized phage protein (TIGR01671 family)